MLSDRVHAATSPNRLRTKATQSVSYFRPFAACRKEGIWGPSWNACNLFAFNILRWAFLAPGTSGQSPAVPACFPLYKEQIPRQIQPGICLASPDSSFLFIPEDLHRQEPRCSSGWNDGCKDRDSHGHERNPQSVENAGMKWHIRHRVHLRIQWNQVIVPRDEGKNIADRQTNKRTGRSDDDSLPQKNHANLFPSRTHGHQ